MVLTQSYHTFGVSTLIIFDYLDGVSLFESEDTTYNFLRSKQEINVCEPRGHTVSPPVSWYWTTVPTSLGPFSLHRTLEPQSLPEGNLWIRSRCLPWNMSTVYTEDVHSGREASQGHGGRESISCPMWTLLWVTAKLQKHRPWLQ